MCRSMAVFGRRERKGWGWRLRQMLWPDSGHGRAVRYLWARLKRLPATPHAIGAGFASGAAVSVLPLIGLHFLLGFALAWLARGNMAAAALGTAVGNPLTFPIFFSAANRLGKWMTATPNGGADPVAETLAEREAEMLASGLDPSLLAQLWPTLKVTLIGGLPLAVIAFAVFYVLARGLAAKFQAARRRRARKLAERPDPAPRG
ncbi:MAG: DUF2062 domain-containing protein [Rubrimonas sp.]|uniref:DUF2062 domain-containing protein n=1 Tax=Rubrimonas sp. TaxID=2036015 RepID=UPI002FDD91BD